MKLQKIRNGLGNVATVVSYGAMIPLFLMVFVVAFDVILRKTRFGLIHGSNELTMFFMVWVCMLGIPALYFKDGHVWVDLFVKKFPYRFRCFWRCAIMAAETAMVGLLAFGGYGRAASFYNRAMTTEILHMPRWIFASAALVAFAVYFLLSLVDTVQLCIDGVKGEEKLVNGGWSDDQVKGI